MSNKRKLPEVLILHSAVPPLTKAQSDQLSDALFELAAVAPSDSEITIRIRPLRSSLTWASSGILPLGPPTFEQ
jgi:hypothetical protein